MANQFVVQLDNRPGALAVLAEALAGAEVPVATPTEPGILAAGGSGLDAI